MCLLSCRWEMRRQRRAPSGLQYRETDPGITISSMCQNVEVSYKAMEIRYACGDNDDFVFRVDRIRSCPGAYRVHFRSRPRSFWGRRVLCSDKGFEHGYRRDADAHN